MILTINAGSSNIKFALFERKTLQLTYKAQAATIEEVLAYLDAIKHTYSITGIGHRIVHGGTKYFTPVILNKTILKQLKTLVPLAPLHQPHNLAAIELFATIYPGIPQVGCFDTAFHVTQQKLARLFAIPKSLTNAGIIRYGFHGLSYEYIASIMSNIIDELANKKVIVAHLGNGSSMCAMNNKRSVATSMGFSALDGLMMGTRCGSIDPGVLLYLLQEQHYSTESLSDLLYNKSGLLGVSGYSNDVRKLLPNSEALELYCYKAACEFGALTVSNSGCDALLFTAGIGENSAIIREKICLWLKHFGLELDIIANKENKAIISADHSKIVVAVIPTNEELIIAQHTLSSTV